MVCRTWFLTIALLPTFTQRFMTRGMILEPGDDEFDIMIFERVFEIFFISFTPYVQSPDLLTRVIVPDLNLWYKFHIINFKGRFIKQNIFAWSDEVFFLECVKREVKIGPLISHRDLLHVVNLDRNSSFWHVIFYQLYIISFKRHKRF